MTLSANTVPVTAASPPGGRPRSGDAPDGPFATWLAGQPKTVKEIADELGLSRWAVYHLRSGFHRPSLEVAVKIADMSRPRHPETGEIIGDPAVPTDSWPEPKPRAPKPARRTAGTRKRKSTRARG